MESTYHLALDSQVHPASMKGIKQLHTLPGGACSMPLPAVQPSDLPGEEAPRYCEAHSRLQDSLHWREHSDQSHPYTTLTVSEGSSSQDRQ